MSGKLRGRCPRRILRLTIGDEVARRAGAGVGRRFSGDERRWTVHLRDLKQERQDGNQAGGFTGATFPFRLIADYRGRDSCRLQPYSTRLIHPPSPRPVILYVHAALSAGWIVLFITQTALICTRNVKYAARLVCVRSRLALQSPLWEFQQRSLWEDCMCNAETRETPMPRRL